MPRARMLTLAVEDVLTNFFFTAYPTIMDELWEAGDLSLTPEELLQRDEARQARQKQHFKNSYIKNGQRMRDKESISWGERNKDKLKVYTDRYRNKNLLEKKFYCTTCDTAFPDSSKLKRHNTTVRHLSLGGARVHGQVLP
ncbi:hypothetical protein QBC42DRAFT_289554 [Cladorrhinum samala]|uniref:C2H2-type domain-containing protein n=1 Tax=Cladorrhinum samala TaxID=585594 RepID=A0AAV9HFZ9_9PEZI|nr:hypothetical protein QBC42DRAFT_289554 [Cladorrhinum samala]